MQALPLLLAFIITSLDKFYFYFCISRIISKRSSALHNAFIFSHRQKAGNDFYGITIASSFQLPAAFIHSFIYSLYDPESVIKFVIIVNHMVMMIMMMQL
jgi:hypothetical protein